MDSFQFYNAESKRAYYEHKVSLRQPQWFTIKKSINLREGYSV